MRGQDESIDGSYSFGRFLAYFLRLGALGFGGPVALAGAMQRDLVDRRRWVEQVDYDEGLALAQLSPGPLAAQLAIYLGWVRGRALGAFLVMFEKTLDAEPVGRVGLWSKADSQVLFDDFTVKRLSP